MITIKDKNIEMSGQIKEIIEELALIKITIIDELGLKKANFIYELAENIVEKNLDEELYTKFETNLPPKLAKKLIKLWKK